MPELPEVETVRAGLAPYVTEQTIQAAIIRCSKLRYPVDNSLSRTLAQRHITQLTRRGKYLLFHLQDGGGLLWHLGMTGSFSVAPLDQKLKKHDHIDLCFDNYCLRYHDPRRFGLVLWTDNFEDHRLLESLGVEPLTRNFSAKYLQQALSKRTIAIKKAIMDGKVVVGVGNIYASESLFHAGISPMKAANELTTEECQALVKSIKHILRKAIRAGGTTLKDFISADGKPGYFKQQLLVYGRANQPCMQCGSDIKITNLSGRSTFYCEHCQPDG